MQDATACAALMHRRSSAPLTTPTTPSPPKHRRPPHRARPRRPGRAAGRHQRPSEPWGACAG
eukprot:5925955-Alexandrium_andersonii.AAC.1